MENRRGSARNPRRVIDVMWETGETWEEREKHAEKDSIGSVDVDPEDLDKKGSRVGSAKRSGLK